MGKQRETTVTLFVDQTKDAGRKFDERDGRDTGPNVDAIGSSLGNWAN